MNELALIAIGAGFGLSLALIAIMVYALVTTASKFCDKLTVSLTKVSDSLTSQKLMLEHLRTEISMSLSRMDAERLYEASLAVQRSAKSLSAQITTLQKVVFAQPAIDTGPETFGIEDEAEDDARMLAEQARWSGQPDPLAGLSEDEKNRRVQQFFQNRARGGISHLGSSPPTAGAGVYASLLEEAQQRVPPTPPPGDFDDANGEDGLDLSGKGELGE